MRIKQSVTLDDVYKEYKRLGGEYNKQEYRIICDKLFKAISDSILDGNVFHLGVELGYICIKRFEKQFRFNNKGRLTNGVVNWQESLKYKKELQDRGEKLFDASTGEGKQWLIFYDEKFNYRWSWIKKYGTCIVKNNTAYSFTPSNDNTVKKLGNKGKLKKLLRENPNQHLKYIHSKND